MRGRALTVRPFLLLLASEMKYADVILPLPLENSYTYSIPTDLEAAVTPGCRVIVHFGKKRYYTAIVMEVHERRPNTDFETKEIYALLDASPVLRRPQLRFWKWIASYYMCKLGDVYKAALPSGLKLESETAVTYNADFEADGPLRPNEQAVLDAFKGVLKLTVSELEKKTGLRNVVPVVASLMARGAVEVSEEMKRGFVPKMQTFIRLSQEYATEERLQEAFADFKRAKKQELLLVCFLDLSHALNPALTVEVSKKELLERSGCSVRRRERIQKKLDLARVDFKGALGASSVIRKFLPESVRKLLVFCRDLADLRQMVPEVCDWLTQAGRSITPFEIHHAQSEQENQRLLAAFREESDRLHVLFSVNMLIEGLHVEGVDAVLFLRRTESYIVTLQQLGRCLDAGSGKQPVVLDFVNNLSGKSVYDVMACHWERLSYLPSPHGFERTTSFLATGYLSDIRLRIEEILAELEPWQIMYERLVEFHREENDWPSVTEGKLGLWCNTQRIAYKRGCLAKERCDQLDAIGFEWNQLDSKWMREYHALKVFFDTCGRWPKREDGPLATWCYTQRERRKDGRLSKERIRALNEIGFVWNQNLQGEWMKNYEELKSFVRKYRRFPKSTEGNLGGWCHTQRKMRKQGKLPNDRRLLLDKIGFVWSAEQVWQGNFEQLCLFHNLQGRWPGCREGALGRWCTIQRRDYRKGNMSDERKAQLERIGFPLA